VFLFKEHSSGIFTLTCCSIGVFFSSPSCIGRPPLLTAPLCLFERNPHVAKFGDRKARRQPFLSLAFR